MKFIRPCLLLFCFVFLVQLIQPAVSSAKMYTWTDKNGVVRRTYYPPPADQVKKSTSTKQSTSSHKKVRKSNVELFVTSWCPYCKQAIQYFRSKGVAVSVYDIEKDKKAAARKNKLDSRGGVPFAVVNGTRIHGYAPDQYAAALKK